MVSFLRKQWSICSGIWWSVCPGNGGQFKLESGGQFHRFFHIIRNNAVFGNTTNYSSGDYSNTTRDHNSYHATWQPSGVVTDASDFMTTDTTGVSGPRQANGDLPNLNFLKLSSTSRLKDSGIDVGITFSGAAPDLGAFEYVAAAIPPVFATNSPMLIGGIPLVYNNQILTP